MRPPVRPGVLVAGILVAAAAVAQAPPPAPPAHPRREVPGGTVVVTPQTETLTRIGPAPGVELAPQPLGYESELHCFGYLGDPIAAMRRRCRIFWRNRSISPSATGST